VPTVANGRLITENMLELIIMNGTLITASELFPGFAHGKWQILKRKKRTGRSRIESDVVELFANLA
jgi:hypothetical protein